MKSDVVHGVVFEQEKELQKMMRSYIPFYNQKRLGSRSPSEHRINKLGEGRSLYMTILSGG